jgi:uncharacterized protein (UPF0335 family)
VLEEGSMNQSPDNVTRLQEINARLEELAKFDILDFWEEIKKLEQEKANLERDIAA